MRYTLEQGVLTLFFEGRVNSGNACRLQAEAFALLEGKPHERAAIDAEGLTYISSAGLRVLLRIRKSEPKLRMTGVSPEIYEILDMTGFTEMFTVEKAYRRFSVDGCEVLGEGSNGVVYRYDPELVIKVYRRSDALEEIHKERELARTALIAGIPTAIPFDVVKVGEKYASVFELLNAESLSKLIRRDPDHIDRYVDIFVELLQLIHETEGKSVGLPNMKDRALGWAEYLREHLPKEQGDRLCTLIENTPDRHTMLHGDYHTNNVEMQNGEALLIDMDTLSYGHPVFELASTYMGLVAFGDVDGSIVERFMKLPIETTRVFWRKALVKYLGTEDEARLRDVEKKAQIVCYARLLRRTLRREADTENGKKLLVICRERLATLLDEVDTLDF